MRDRLITLCGALGALLIFVALIYQPEQASRVSLPTTLDHAENGYLGLSRWLTVNDIPQASFRNRFSRLAQDYPEPGNVLLVTFPFTQPARDNELDDLHRWVSGGNTLVVMAALNESPDWALGHTEAFIERMGDLSTVFFRAIPDETTSEDSESTPANINLGTPDIQDPTAISYTTSASHPLMENTYYLSGVTDSITSLWEPIPETGGPTPIRVATVDGYDAGGLWQQAYKQGSIVISGSASLFSNRQINEEDNAQLIANLIALHLGEGRSFIIDDYHHGISEIYDPDAFFADARLHSTLLLTLAFWLIYMLGSTGRLGQYTTSAPPLQQSSLVGALAGFLQRKLSAVDAGKLMIESWLRQTAGVEASIPELWRRLQTMPLIDAEHLSQLETHYTSLLSGQSPPLKEINNLINQLERSRG